MATSGQPLQAQFSNAAPTPVTVDWNAAMGSGGTADVYAASTNGGNRRFAAKIYRPEHSSAQQYEKLEYLISHPVPIQPPNLAAAPAALLRDRRHTPVGFLMPLIAPERWQPLVKRYNRAAAGVSNPDDPDWKILRWQTAVNLSQALADVHAAGHAVGDLSENNALSDDSGAVALLDVDGWQVNGADGRRWNCSAARSEYTPPEITARLNQRCLERDCPQGPPGAHQVKQGCVPRTADHDNFILALLIFKLLMQGEEPFRQNRDRPHLPGENATPTRLMAAGLFSYGSKHYQCCGPRNAQAKANWEALPVGIREQMEAALTA